MATRRAITSDGPDLIHVLNETTELQGFCMTGGGKRPIASAKALLDTFRIWVHENSLGQIDAFLCWTDKAHETPETTIMAFSLSRAELSAAQACLEATIAVFQDISDNGYEYVDADIAETMYKFLPFIDNVPKQITFEAKDSRTKFITERQMRFHVPTTLAWLKAQI